MKLAYLSDMFQKLNELNLQMQGTNTHLPQLADKITSFTRKLEMWEQRVKEGNIDSFESLKSFTEVNKLQNTVIPCMTTHISALQKHFQRYFPVQDPAKYDWIRDPFSARPPADFSTAEQEQFIDVTSDSTMRLQFKSKALAAFWIGVEKDYPLLGRRALAILLPFATSYLCEIGFSAVASIKTKYRSKLDIENELRVAVSQLHPRFERICSTKQAHPSHWKDCGTSKNKSKSCSSKMFIFVQRQVWENLLKTMNTVTQLKIIIINKCWSCMLYF